MTTIEIRPHDRAAAEEYLGRRDRTRHPDGTFDKAGRWFPSDAEHQPCCIDIRHPSRGHPYSLMHHCRTLGHMCRLYEAEPVAVRMAVREIEGRPTAEQRRTDAVAEAEAILRAAS